MRYGISTKSRRAKQRNRSAIFQKLKTKKADVIFI